MDNSTHNYSELLVRYLDGELSPSEITELERELASNADLQSELNSLKQAREGVKLYGINQKVSGIHNEMMKEFKSPPVRQISQARKIIRYSLSAAAIIILLVVGVAGYTFYNLSVQKVYEGEYRSYELGTSRDDQPSSVIETTYRNKDYKKLVLLTDSSTNPKDLFLRGMAEMELKTYPAASLSFQKALAIDTATGGNTIRDEAEYYLALSFIAREEYDRAIEILEKIKKTPTHLYNTAVSQKLIRRLKLLKWR